MNLAFCLTFYKRKKGIRKTYFAITNILNKSIKIEYIHLFTCVFLIRKVKNLEEKYHREKRFVGHFIYPPPPRNSEIRARYNQDFIS